MGPGGAAPARMCAEGYRKAPRKTSAVRTTKANHATVWSGLARTRRSLVQGEFQCGAVALEQVEGLRVLSGHCGFQQGPAGRCH